jgi:hypothetical protein
MLHKKGRFESLSAKDPFFTQLYNIFFCKSP